VDNNSSWVIIICLVAILIGTCTMSDDMDKVKESVRHIEEMLVEDRAMDEATVNGKVKIENCPDCGAGVKFYHSSVTHGDGTTRVVCEKKCQGLKVLREFERTQLKML